MWVPNVAAGSRTAFEEQTGIPIRIRNKGSEVLPLSARDAHLPVTFLVSKEGTDFMPSFDLGPAPFLAEVLERARDSGEMAASGRIIDGSRIANPSTASSSH